MADVNGRFVWYELMTTDLAKAREFYKKVVGWTDENPNMGDMEYWMFKAGDISVAGAMTQPDAAKQMGAPPAWFGYVAVADVDANAEKVKAIGGQVYAGPQDIPNVGRFAIVADPAGAAIGLFKSSNPDEDRAEEPEGVGHIGWNELHGGEVNASVDFYSKLFGWEKKDAMDMGEMGPYQMFGLGEVMIGGMMKNPPGSPAPPHWSYYINIDNIDRAVERVKAAGGQIVMDPTEVPGGDWVAVGMDPQAAAFALVGHR
jgi:predicted enzyme related to lactoylglutathione lyase